jgi:hypothetical protein
VELLLTWRCSVPERAAQIFLSGFAEDVIAPTDLPRNETHRFFNVGIDEGEHAVVIESARRFLSANSSKLRQLIELGGSSQFDFGLLVGADNSFAPSLVFEPAFLAELATHQVELRVSGYPVSEDTE